MQAAPFMLGNYGQMDTGYSSAYNVLWFILMLLVWGAIIGLIAYAVRAYVRRTGTTSHEHRDPLDIARERFAKGEIDKAQLDEIKKELRR